jgi:hypothetical protein
MWSQTIGDRGEGAEAEAIGLVEVDAERADETVVAPGASSTIPPAKARTVHTAQVERVEGVGLPTPEVEGEITEGEETIVVGDRALLLISRRQQGGVRR